jgi:hypothetical protein
MRALILHLKHKYFEQVASGEKRHEFRLVKPYWEKRLIGKSYDIVKIWDGFKPEGMHSIYTFPYLPSALSQALSQIENKGKATVLYGI